MQISSRMKCATQSLTKIMDTDLRSMKKKSTLATPYLARQMLCLGRVTPGVKDTPFLGSARGVKEAVDLFTRREFVDGSEVRKQTHNNLPSFRPLEG